MPEQRSVVSTLEVNAVRLSYRDCGDPDAPPVLLLHGSGSDAATWDRFVVRLTAAGYRCLAVDLRGHAGSARCGDYSLTGLRDDVRQLLERLALTDVTVIGHSVGGYAALAADLASPGRIGRLVLEDLAAPPRPAAPGAPGRTVPTGRAVPAGRAGRTDLTDLTRLLRGLAAAIGILTRRRNYHLRAAASFIRQLSRPDADWWARLDQVRTPTLILSGGPASCIPPQRLAEVAAAIPGARLTTIPVGHRVHSLAPQRFADEVLAFLAEPVGAPAAV
jgi:3-oxoadipate enol-lactonase